MKKIFSQKSLTAFLEDYANGDMLRAHMPGHKGCAPPDSPQLQSLYAMDITEISGADSLFEADGVLLAGEQRSASLWGSGAVCWSAGGSTLCIQAMLAQMRAEGRTIIAGRTVHRSFLNSCVLLGLDVHWVMPRQGGIISGHYDPQDFADAIASVCTAGKRPCVYVTSPDYTGVMQDIAALAALCHAQDAPLLVDNAHGAHLAFLAENRHPMALGADYCCDSAHKMLPALTGAALLHCRNAAMAPVMKQHMQMFGSTSPSYPIMQSIESCTAYLEAHPDAVRQCEVRASNLRELLAERYAMPGDDPLHLTLAADGCDLAGQLRAKGVECEYADRTCLVLLLSPVMTDADFDRLAAALLECIPKPPAELPPLPPSGERVCDLRTAALAAWEILPVRESIGRVCGPVQVPCPPAVPLCISGERITEEMAALMEFYGISAIAVVAESVPFSGRNSMTSSEI